MEQKWLKQAARGNEAAFEQLVIKYQGQIYNLCLRLTGNEEDAADMTQDSFLKAWKNLDSFHGESAFSTWLYRLASNTCLDLLRSRKRRPQTSLNYEDEDGEDQAMDIADPTPTPEEQLLFTEEREQLRCAMAALEEDQRQILTLRVVNDLSYGQIAEILSVKEGTVKSRLSRARDQLRKNLEAIGNNFSKSTSNKQKGGPENAL